MWLSMLRAGAARARQTLRTHACPLNGGWPPGATWRDAYRDIGAGCKCDLCRLP